MARARATTMALFERGSGVASFGRGSGMATFERGSGMATFERGAAAEFVRGAGSARGAELGSRLRSAGVAPRLGEPKSPNVEFPIVPSFAHSVELESLVVPAGGKYLENLQLNVHLLGTNQSRSSAAAWSRRDTTLAKPCCRQGRRSAPAAAVNITSQRTCSTWIRHGGR